MADRDHTKTTPERATVTKTAQGGVVARPATTTTATPFRPGQLLDDYIIGDVLGEGGMGIVLAARDPDLDRQVAIKVLRREVFGDDGLLQARARLLREAQAMAKLSHPNVITVYRIGVFDDRTYVAMEYVDGGTLREWVKGKSHDEIIGAYLAAAEGLVAAHAVGLVHRDFKPDNVLVGRDGRVRVTDFGLVASEPSTRTRARAVSLTLTQTGAVLGTPAYMAPEQHEGLPTDARADQFAFCVSLYEALYGERPFASPTLEALVANVLGEKIVTPALDTVPRQLRRTLLRGMARDPAARFPSLIDVIERLSPSAATRLHAIWDAERRACVRSVFGRIELPRAVELHARIEGALDRWADAWLDRHAEHLRSIRERANVGKTAAFLERRLDELEHVIAALERVDASTLDSSLALVIEMTPIDQLDELIPLPADLARRGKIAALAARVAELTEAERLGHHDQAQVLALELAEPVARTEYAPLIAHHAFAEGRLHQRNLDLDKAAVALRRAAAYAARAGDTGVEAAALTTLVANYEHDPGRVEDLLLAARSAVARARSPLETARLELVVANIRYAARDYPAARASFDAAIALWAVDLASDPRAFDVGYRMHANFGALLATLGDTDGARAAFARSREILVGAASTDHPLVGDLELNTGHLEAHFNDHAAAAEQYERALASYRRAYGARHKRVAVAMHHLAEKLVRLDQDTRARSLFEESYAMRKELFGDDHLAVAESMCHLGMALVRDGRIEEGGSMIADAVNMRMRHLGADDPSVAEARGFLSHALSQDKQLHDALAQCEIACEIYKQHAMQFEYALYAHGAAMLHYRLGNKPTCAEWLDRSDAAWQQVDRKHPHAIDTRFIFAQHLWEIGDRARAKELGAAARDAAGDAGIDSAREIIANWLAGLA